LGQDRRELGLLLGGRSRATAARTRRARPGHRHRRPGRDAELRLPRLHELRELEPRDSLAGFHYFLLTEGHDCCPLPLVLRGAPPPQPASPSLRSGRWLMATICFHRETKAAMRRLPTSSSPPAPARS